MSASTTTTPREARPCIKFAGGKRQLLPHILPLLPKKIACYYEPFVGGGAVFFALSNESRFQRAVLSDTNAELMTMYRAVQTAPRTLLQKLEAHQDEHKSGASGLVGADYYYHIRSQDLRGQEAVKGSDIGARMIFLNKCGYNGMYRVNKQGLFNIPYGHPKSPNIVDVAAIMSAHEAFLANVTLATMDFEQATKSARPGDAVYLDPPYIPLSKTSNFTSYQEGGFGEADHVRLRDTALALKKRGVFVLLSHSSADLSRKLYSGKEFTVREVDAARAINSVGSKRGAVKELLIT